MSFQVLGLTFHLYGLIVGVAISVALYLAEFLAKKEDISQELLWKYVGVLLMSAVIGARVWHVMTDWSLYANNWGLIPQVWNGGLSIIGAIAGGAVGVFGLSVFSEEKPALFLAKVADITALVLPIAQAIGRLGNYVNQELYGLPTTLPWGIFIDSQHRLPQFAQQTHFHPLFAYEAVGMLVVAAVLWWQYLKKKWQVGSTKYALLYLSWYGIFRGVLEFLRPDKTFFLGTILGFNQVILLVTGMISIALLLRKTQK